VRFKWTEEKLAELVSLARAGFSSAAIAKRLGVSRSAAAHRGKRLGISFSRKPKVIAKAEPGHRAADERSRQILGW